MSGWRDREAAKQVRARRINEWTMDDSTVRGRALGPLRCECRDPECHELLAPTLGEYEAVRAHATRFIVARDHENPETERIVEENARFGVVESVTGEAAGQARRSAPRRPHHVSAPRGDACEPPSVGEPCAGNKPEALVRLQEGGQMSTEEQEPEAFRLDEEREGQGGGRAALSISNAMVQLLSRRAGRGPTKVKTTVTGEFVVVTVRDWLTVAEKSLLDEGHRALVVDGRAALSAGICREATTVVEEATGRRVAAFLTDHDPDQNLAVMVALFRQPETLRMA